MERGGEEEEEAGGVIDIKVVIHIEQEVNFILVEVTNFRFTITRVHPKNKKQEHVFPYVRPQIIE